MIVHVLAALATIVASVGVALPAAAAAPAVTNPDFSAVAATGVPTGWSTWNPAGTATLTVAADGPAGASAATIAATSGATARFALTQKVTVDAATTRRLVVRAMVKGVALDGGYSMVRVQVRNAAGTVVVPVASGPYLRGTFDWTAVETPITLPEGAASLSIEPMLDRSGGSLSVTGVEIAEDTSAGTLTATATAAGTVELRWSFTDLAPSSYRVRRGAAGEEPTDTVRTTTAPTVADESVAAASAYAYEVDALDADGAVLATTPTAAVSTPAAFDDLVSAPTLVAAQVDAATARVSWAVPSSAASDLALRSAAGSVPLAAATGTLELAAASGETVELVAAGQTVADAVVGARAHPRTVVDPQTVARVQESLAAGEPTVTGAWQALLARLADPAQAGYSTNGSAGLYEARDAAFAYAITGDSSYAEQAYQAVLAGEAFVTARETNMGLELGRAALLLAPAYDWSSSAWTPQQRERVRVIMLRVSELLSTYHHENLDGVDKASNWVGVVRAPELAMLLVLRDDTDAVTSSALDRRILFLADQVAQHVEEAYGDTGWTQEGWDYFHYTELYLFPSVALIRDSGMSTLDAALASSDFVQLALHVVSARENGDVAQFGVAGPNGQVDGALPLLFAAADDARELGQLLEIYDRVQGIGSASSSFDGAHGLWTVLFSPTAAERAAALAASAAPAVLPALRDDAAGFAAFRSDVSDADDTIVVTSNRNSQHAGWAAAETFSLSWIGSDTTWAGQGGKHYDDPSLWSKPLVDGQLEAYQNQYRTVGGGGRTLESRGFAAQGGGYLRLDGAANFGVDTALRQEAVDLRAGGAASAVVAIADTFSDDQSHEWTWQLHPEDSVQIAVFPDSDPLEPLFTFSSVDASGAPVVLSGFVPDREGLQVVVDDGSLQLIREGTGASFQVVMATAAVPLTARAAAAGIVVDDRLIPLDDLSSVPGSGFAAAAAGTSRVFRSVHFPQDFRSVFKNEGCCLLNVVTRSCAR